jgi:SWI/SNF-related matrix-associated actin-dependent regulator of chromatin subfamily A member 5
LLDQKAKTRRGAKEDSVNRFKYLLGLTDLFRHFIDLRAKDDKEFKNILKEADISASNARKTRSQNRRRKSEREEDAELLHEEEEEDQVMTVFTESPHCKFVFF